MSKEEKAKETAVEEKAAAPAEAPKEEPKEEPKVEIKMEDHYPENEIKDGEVFLKRLKGKPRWRKILAKNYQAKLFLYEKDEWKQKTAQTAQRHLFHDFKWHLRNKWEKVEKFTPPPKPKAKPKAAEGASPNDAASA